MREQSQVSFALLRRCAATVQGLTQSTLESGEETLDLIALTVNEFVEVTIHLPTVTRFRPATASTFIQCNHGAAHAQFLPSRGVIALGVVARVSQHAVDPHPLHRSSQDRHKQRSVVARPSSQQCVDHQVGAVVADQGELGPTLYFVAFLVHAPGVVRRAMPSLQARAVDRSLFFRADHAAGEGGFEDGVEQAMVGVFFNRRCCAL